MQMQHLDEISICPNTFNSVVSCAFIYRDLIPNNTNIHLVLQLQLYIFSFIDFELKQSIHYISDKASLAFHPVHQTVSHPVNIDCKYTRFNLILIYQCV